MKKNIFLLVVAAITCMSICIASIKKSKNDMNTQLSLDKIPHEQIVIAFDLHEVIFSFSYSKFFGSVCGFLNKNPYSITLCNPFACYRVLNTLYSNSKTAENIYNKLTDKHYSWLADSKTEFLAVCNSYILDPEMEKLLLELKKQGYRLAVCSNIGQQAFEHFQREHAEIFDLFEVIITSHPERNYMRKPAPEFFEHFKKETEKVVKDPKAYIFIDDKKTNAHAAKKCGIEAIIFKKPMQLRTALGNLLFTQKFVK